MGLLAYFNAHDDSTPTSQGGAQSGPGSADKLATAPELKAGNVVLEYGVAADRAALRSIAQAEAGSASPDASLIKAGQAVILRHKAGLRGVHALAFERSLDAASAKDPAVEDFVAYWLGRGNAG